MGSAVERDDRLHVKRVPAELHHAHEAVHDARSRGVSIAARALDSVRAQSLHDVFSVAARAAHESVTTRHGDEALSLYFSHLTFRL